MSLVSKLDAPSVYVAIRNWRTAYVSRDEIVKKLADEFGVQISISGLDHWLRSRSKNGGRSRFRHQLPPPPLDHTANQAPQAMPTKLPSPQPKSTKFKLPDL
jgi:hypothetical protein